jgi:hypothetical protein
VVDRYLINTQAEFRVTYYVDGTPTDPAPASAVVTITRDDGTNIVSAAPATLVTPGANTTAGTFAYTLQPNQMTQLDWLTLTWVSALGSVTTRAEVTGGFLVSLAELESLYPTWTIQQLRDRRTASEEALEKACGRAFVPRYARETRIIGRRGRTQLRWGDIRNIRGVVVGQQFQGGGTVTYNAATIASLGVDWEPGVIWGLPSYSSGMWTGTQAVISYEHGADFADHDAHDAVLDVIGETYVSAADSRVIRREADHVAVTYASPSNDTDFVTPSLISFVRGHRRPLAA